MKFMHRFPGAVLTNNESERLVKLDGCLVGRAKAADTLDQQLMHRATPNPKHKSS